MPDLGDPNCRWSATQMRALENLTDCWLGRLTKNGGVQQHGSEVGRWALVSLLPPLMAFGWGVLPRVGRGTGQVENYMNLIPSGKIILGWDGT